jgi:lipopolysaccharide/colanic/teichoic acid biosynthesis glycosyltransferase
MQRVVERSGERPLPTLHIVGKRAIDVAGSLAGIILLSPLLALIALAVTLDSRGPIIFRQQRVGKGGELFTCLKFRTMKHKCDESIHRQAIERLMAGERLSADDRAAYKLDQDPRVTRVGSLLRRTSLDELPQLFNVLRGEMSLVGPRPAIPYELESYKDWHHARYSVKPGITGLWQVRGRGALTFDEMLRLDVDYANSWSVGTDIRLLLQTIPVVMRQVGAR